MPSPPRPRGKRFGDSIIVDNEYVYLLVGNEWYFYCKRRAHIGNGGIGNVLLGYRVKDHCQVAIKRIRPQFASKQNIRERVRLESQLVYSHPNLVETLGCCETPGDEGAIFVISKFIQGQTIDVYVNSFFHYGLERVRHIIVMLRQLAAAVDFIHSKGIIHLDIKPSNIMVEKGSTIRLLDLGIANVTYRKVNTHGYGLHGTPGYAAPEQYLDESNPELHVDHHTDIYGMGATAYALITGCTPDKPNAPLAYKMNDNLKLVLDKALSPDKASRYDSAHDFVDALEQAYNEYVNAAHGIKKTFLNFISRFRSHKNIN